MIPRSLTGHEWGAEERVVKPATHANISKGEYKMKKVLSAIVILALMTFFCGTAMAADDTAVVKLEIAEYKYVTLDADTITLQWSPETPNGGVVSDTIAFSYGTNIAMSLQLNDFAAAWLAASNPGTASALFNSNNSSLLSITTVGTGGGVIDISISGLDWTSAPETYQATLEINIL